MSRGSKIVRIHCRAERLDLLDKSGCSGVVGAQRLVEAVRPAALHQSPDQALRPIVPGALLPELQAAAVQPEQLVRHHGRENVDRVPGHEGLQYEQATSGLDRALLRDGPARLGPQAFRQLHAPPAQRLQVGIRLPFEDDPLAMRPAPRLVRSGVTAAEQAHQLVRLTRDLLQERNSPFDVGALHAQLMERSLPAQ